MATPNGQPEYKVSLLPAIRDKLQAFWAQAEQRGLGPLFLIDAEGVERRLIRDPLNWGDPLFEYHKLGMVKLRGRSTFLYVYYSVHKQGRVVVVQDLDINPHGPLGSSS